MMQEKIQVSSQQELLYELGEHLVSMNSSRFIPLKNAYVYPELLKSSRPISYDGVDYVNGSGVIVNLTLPEESFLYKIIADKHGMEGRHGTLQETVDAAWSKETVEYKNSVLTYWIKNGIVIRRFSNTYDVSRVLHPTIEKTQSEEDVILKREGNLLETENVSAKELLGVELGPTIQTSIPTPKEFEYKFRYFKNFSGAIPTDEDLGERTGESRGRFGEIYFDKQGLASVWSFWYSGDGVLLAGADRPLGRGSDGALVVWTDKNPKK